MATFDRAWDIAKKDDPDYSKFGEKFARKIMDMKEGAKGLPEGTKFSDLRSTSEGIEEPFMGSGGGMRFRRESGKFPNERIFIPDNMKYPKSLIDRAKRQSGMPQPDIETEEFES
tara:strand:- start:1479 stop:1823 length:345 start_codon:yes stop_codon:yes gene_type:complete